MQNMKGGWRMDFKPYSDWARRRLDRMIGMRRPLLKLPDDAERGERFHNDDAVRVRVQSNYTEDEFMLFPAVAVDAMLTDAAKSDHWYAHEKDYQSEPSEKTEIAEDDSDA